MEYVLRWVPFLNNKRTVYIPVWYHQQQHADKNEDPEDPYTKMSPHINGIRFTLGFIFK